MKYLVLFTCLSIMACSTKNNAQESTTPTELNSYLVALLDTIYRMEQEPLELSHELMRAHGAESLEFQEQQKIVYRNHAINEKKIAAILAEYGWPGEAVIGEQGSLTICNVIQHSDNEIRLKYLPMMKKAVKEKKLHPRLLARAEDRIATEQNQLQIYGGQMKYYPATKSFNVWPIYDPENIDKRRAAIGLGPIAEHLKNRFDFEWNLEEQIKRTAAFEAEMKKVKK